jgi:hypothetical protein
MKKLALIVLIAVLIAVGFAYSAANTVPPTGAGDGGNIISGYDVYNVHYVLASDPTRIAGVTFTVTATSGAASPTEVKIKLVSNGGAWFDCTAGQNYSWSCPINGQVTVLEADELRVVAGQ